MNASAAETEAPVWSRVSRPVAATVADVLAEERGRSEAGYARPALKPEGEAALLKAWQDRA